MMNVTAKYSNGAVHLGGHEFNGRWSPACGIQHHNGGGRTPNPLYPTDKAVTCKRCLKAIERDAAKAQAERELSKELRVSHGGVGAAQADNRAGLLSLAADRIHKPVHAALVKDFDKALTKAEAKPFHRKLQQDIGLRW